MSRTKTDALSAITNPQEPTPESGLSLGTHNPFNNLWSESGEVMVDSEEFAKDALKHIAAKKRVKHIVGKGKSSPK